MAPAIALTPRHHRLSGVQYYAAHYADGASPSASCPIPPLLNPEEWVGEGKSLAFIDEVHDGEVVAAEFVISRQRYDEMVAAPTWEEFVNVNLPVSTTAGILLGVLPPP